MKLLVVIVFLGVSAAGNAIAHENLSIRYIKGSSGKPNEMHAQGTIKASPEKVWDAIVRLNDWSSFMPRMPASFYITDEGISAIQTAGTREANLLKKVSEKYRTEVPRQSGGLWQGAVFQIVSTPFPVKNRWFVLRYTNDETLAGRQIFKQCWEMIAANVDFVRGCFLVQSDEKSGHSLVYYEEIVDLGGHVPNWVTKIGVKSTTPDVFKNLEKEAGKASHETDPKD
ncbi:MAG: hypothetical protein HYT76_02645 [Deltaproteobacteria bacterium]|nr:hypothetical protein [Deltaproteobacteria bacterium]